MELAWRIDAMLELVKEGQDLLRWIKGESNTSYRPDSPSTFDPLKTIGKYCQDSCRHPCPQKPPFPLVTLSMRRSMPMNWRES